MNDPAHGQWEVFITEAKEHLTRLGDGLGEPSHQHSASAEALSPPEIEHVRNEIALVEVAAWMAGSDGLAAALHRLRHTLGKQPDRHMLLATIAKLAVVVRQIEDPATIDGAAVAQTLDDALDPWQSESSTKTLEPKQADDFVWTPTVDEQLLSAFVDECTERIENLSGKLLTLEQSDDCAPLLDEIFRDLHTLKGSAAFVSLDPLKRLAHAAEDLVGELKNGRKMVDSSVVDALLNAKDSMSATLDQALGGGTIPARPVEHAVFLLHHPMENAAGHPLIEQRQEAADTASSATPASPRVSLRSPGTVSNTIRVGFEKLDTLLNLVGELVVSKANLHVLQQSSESLAGGMADLARSARQALTGANDDQWTGLVEETDRVGRFAREVSRNLDDHLGRLDFMAARLRDQVMALRMVPVTRIFTKHERTVRDLSRALGKSVRLVLHGQDTELDKMMVEQLDEPLLHLVRNAIDHGIEEPATRRARGKPEQGTLTLSAEHRGAQLLIRIRDDGGGIDPDAVRAKAIERSLVDAEQARRLDRRQILQFLFQPGFSTAKEVTSISGRGVGLDVVVSVLNRLRGSVSVDSQPGQGTVFTLTIPLTLAIRQVLVVRICGRLCALPLDWVKRTVTVQRGEINLLAGRPVYGTSPPIGVVQMQAILGLPPNGETNDHLILVEQQDRSYALACQELVGRQEVLVKTMGTLLAAPPFVSGATILDGRVVPILDLAALVQTHLDGYPTTKPSTDPNHDERTSSPNAKTVLLVDDSPPARALLGRMYQQLGFEVVEAADGRQASDLARTQPFDLISTDVRMPIMDGYELARVLRANPQTQRIPIVMISAKEDRIDVIRGFDSGVDAYLSKPVDKDELARTVTRIVRGDRQ